MRYWSLNNPQIKQKRFASAGFTLIEVLIISPIIVLLIGAFVATIITMTGNILAARAGNTMTYNLQDTLERIESDVELSTNFLATNDFTIVSPQGFNNTTEGFNNASTTRGDVLILQSLLTTMHPTDKDRELVFRNDKPGGCAARHPLTSTIVYFVKDGSLWRRVLMPSNYSTISCSPIWQQPSCNPSVSTASFCRADDVQLVSGVSLSDFIVDYYTRASSSTSNVTAQQASATAASRQSALNTTNSVQVTITATQTAAGREVSRNMTLRSTRQNLSLD